MSPVPPPAPADGATLPKTQGAATLQGYLDDADWYQIRGWAYDRDQPEDPQWLEVVVDDAAPVAFLANLYRPDLVQAGFSHGRFGFLLRFPTPLDPRVAHRVTVRRRSDQAELLDSPRLLARAPSAAAEARQAFEASITAEIAAESDVEREGLLAFLLQQVDRLLQGQADMRSGTAALQRFRLRWNDMLDGARAVVPPPDPAPWALVAERVLPAADAPILVALQRMGYRVAVVASQDMATTGPLASALALAGISVLGAPLYYTMEDVLRRHAGLFRVVVLSRPLLGAAYGVLCRVHQPACRLIGWLGEPVRDQTDPVVTITAALVTDAVVIETETAAEALRRQIPGRAMHVLPAGADVPAVMAVLGAIGVVQASLPRAVAAPSPVGAAS